MSGAFVGPELAAEFGSIPPSFLPVMNRRLYELQIQSLSKVSQSISITLPREFVLSEIDVDFFKAHEVEVLRVDPYIPLGKSLADALKQASNNFSHLLVHHGDTLFETIPKIDGCAYSSNEARHYYRWAGFETNQDGHISGTFEESLDDGTTPQRVLSGLFSFSAPGDILSFLETSSSFTNALDGYAKSHRVSVMQPERWLDFGHLQSFFGSRSRLTTERAFNSLDVSKGIVTKSSTKIGRVDAESFWYENLPANLRLFTPQYLGRQDSSYQIEYLSLPTLADLFVFSRLPAQTWGKILDACGSFLESFALHPTQLSAAATTGLYESKLLSRVEEWSRNTNIDLDTAWSINGEIQPSINEVCSDIISRLCEIPAPISTAIHGDFCFANILYDSRCEAIKVIDPRGEDASGIKTIFGDPRYDLAKLQHSAIGLFDLIISGHVTAREVQPYGLVSAGEVTERQKEIQIIFKEFLSNLAPELTAGVEEICCSLFFSMLPLHADNPNRQRALLATGFRLYKELGEKK